MEVSAKGLLKDELAALVQMAVEMTPPALQAAAEADLTHIDKATGATALREGQAAADFTLPDAYGAQVTLSTLLQKGPVVLTFYRGEWCPFCKLTLRAYQLALPQIKALGGSLVAVSPQTPDKSLLTARSKGLTYPVLSDLGNHVARQYGLVFKVTEALQPFSGKLAEYNGDDSDELPVPGTFVIGQDSVVKLAYVDAFYFRRLEPKEIIAALTALKTGHK